MLSPYLLRDFAGYLRFSPMRYTAFRILTLTSTGLVPQIVSAVGTRPSKFRFQGVARSGTPEPEPLVLAPPVMMPMPGTGRGHLNLATSIRSLRLRSGLSQRQLAGRMSVPRTYVSKIENEKATPTLSSLERLARALEVTVPELLSGGEKNRQDEISELMKDQFIAEILPFVSQLNGMQMSSILTQVRDLTIRPRRTA
jgi:transcriptional regulator with XRE-family HTH domain